MGQIRSFFERVRRDDRGQVLVSVAFMSVALIAMSALVLDLGRAFVDYKELQASTDAAALAGAQSLPGNAAVATATSYSSVAGNKNVRFNLPNVTMVAGYPKLYCSSLLTSEGIPCVAPAAANAITVVQQVTVPMYFAGLFHHQSLTLVAKSSAAMSGGATTPYNVAIIVDTTASMNSIDSDSTCLATRLSCALSGVQTLMGYLNPCASILSTCGGATNGNVTNPVDKVSIFTFPGLVSTTSAAKDYACPSQGNPTIAAYTYPTTPVYQVVPFSSDYKTSSLASALNTTSNLVIAAAGNPLCPGMQAPGGEGTYTAGAIYAAQAALVAAASANSQNVMIVLSDGDSSATAAHMTGASTTSGLYESTIYQCRQAVQAAQAAANAGTKVYTIAYGATSTGCSTDAGTISPCQTMEQIASSPQYFYSDYTATGGSSACVSASQPTTNLKAIFAQIAGSLSVARLIPYGTP